MNGTKRLHIMIDHFVQVDYQKLILKIPFILVKNLKQ